MSNPYAPPALVTELTQRLHAFFAHLDNRRYDDVLNLFLPQGRWLRQGRWLEGREAILGALGARPTSMKVRHVISNILVTTLADNEAHVEAYMTAYRQLGNEAPTLFRINLVTNVYRLVGGAWMLAEQQLLPEFDFTAGQRASAPTPFSGDNAMDFTIIPSGATLGARVEGLDLSKPLSDANFEALVQALGRHGVLKYPRQTLTSQQLRDFAARFGELEVNVANAYQEQGLPEVMILSNMKQDGKPLGLADAGQDWHTDMSYSNMIAFTNVLYGITIPRRDGKTLGNTEFCNMHAAYDGLPQEWKERLVGMTATHDFNKFWEMMRRERGSARPPLTPEQRAAKPPVSHPLFMTHPITGKRILYANPGYAIRINEMSEADSEEALAFLFKHQTRPEYRYANQWEEHDLLMWDNMGTIHNAVADYLPQEHRYIKRCQVAATRFFHADGTPRETAGAAT